MDHRKAVPLVQHFLAKPRDLNIACLTEDGGALVEPVVHLHARVFFLFDLDVVTALAVKNGRGDVAGIGRIGPGPGGDVDDCT